MRILLVALVALLFAGEASAADGYYKGESNCTGTAATSIASIDSGEFASWCPVSTTSMRIRVRGVADFVWNGDTTSSGAGTRTLSVKGCSGPTSATNDCKTPLLDDYRNEWVITSNTATSTFSLPSGMWLITSSGTAANGLLRIEGR